MAEEKNLSDIIAAYKKSIDHNTFSRLNLIPNSGKGESVFSLFRDMLHDSKKGNYKLLSLSTVITFIGTLLYVVSPVDIIPDSIGIVGVLDDMAVIAYAIRIIYEELCAYKLWLATRDLPVERAERIIKKTMTKYNEIN